MWFLLLCAGDIETNPGPETRSNSSLAPEYLPTDPSKQMQTVFRVLKDIQVCSLESSKIKADLAADVKEIKMSQKKIEDRIASIEKSFDTLEKKNRDSRSASTGYLYYPSFCGNIGHPTRINTSSEE